MTIEGIDDFQARLKAALPKAKAEVSAALYKFGEEVMADSKQVVPVDTGALMATGKVTLPEEKDSVIEVTAGYGDEAVGYALYVHEELNAPSGGAIHYTRPGSRPKFLERPAMAKASELPGRVRDALLKAFTE